MNKELFLLPQKVATELAHRDTDLNEFAKVATYLHTHLNGAQFFRLLDTMVKDGRYLVRSGRTLDYYRDIRDVCQQHLNSYRDAKGAKAKEMAEILGWAVRLMRYYKEVGVPQAPVSRPQDAVAPSQPSSSARLSIPNTGLFRKRR